MKKKQIAILGSTGSIGTQALKVIEEHPDLYEAYALTANNQVELLAEQARKFMPAAVVIANEAKYLQLKEMLADLPIQVYAGADALCEIDADILMMAKNVDGIYDSDPKTNPYAKKYETLKYADIINQGLKVIDFTAATMCMENNVPTLAFGLNEENSIVRAICGEKLGTLIQV